MPAGTQTVTRAFAVLGCFRESQRDLGASDIARLLDLSTSTVHRLAQSLVEVGFLEQDVASSRYRLGATLAEYGQLVYRQRRVHLAEPELRRLARRTRHVVALAIRRGNDAVLITEATASTAPHDVVGVALPLHASAMGKVLLAWSPGIDLRSLDLTPRTERTLTTVDALRAELERVRALGYALNDEELDPGIRTIAVPVGGDGDAPFALAVRGPSARITEERIPVLVDQATTAAARISGALARP
ncbi:MAG: putative transcriptional regulator, IclR family [Actinomycetia bacterium]|nr:putative transcriptional regulator, IclR family [Actinomycetes bacterium]